MTEAVDPVTTALTGHLPFHLVLAALITWPTALGLLGLYRRAVRRSMRTSASPTSAIRVQAADTTSNMGEAGAARPRATLHDLPLTTSTAEGDTLLSHLMDRPRRAALAYSLGGAAYGLIMAVAQLLADGLEFRPIRFFFLFWVFIWPVVLTAGIVAAATRAARMYLAAAYFVCLFAIGGLGILFSPDLTWSQVALSWAMNDLPPTILLAAYLSRGVRAVGPLVLTFMLLALIGSDIAVAIVASDDDTCAPS